MVDRITSARNPQLQRVRQLARRPRARLDEQAYVIEGPGLIREAAAAGVDIQAVYFEAPFDLGVDLPGVPLVEVDPGLIAKVATTVTPQPALAVAALPPGDRPRWSEHDFVVVAVDVGDPGNLGTIMRSAAAAGSTMVVCAGSSADPYNPKVVRSAAGSLFRLGVRCEPDPVAAIGSMQEAGLVAVAAVVEGGAPPSAVDLARPVALAVGSEARGLGPEVLDQVDLQVTIPMPGESESLNVAMAATVLCFEAARQRADRSTRGEP